MTRSASVFGIVFGLVHRVASSGREAIRISLLLLAVSAAPCRADGTLHTDRTPRACGDARSTAAASADQSSPQFVERDGLFLVRGMPAYASAPPWCFRPEKLTPLATDAASVGRARGAAADKLLVLALVALLELPVRLLRGLLRRLRPGHRARDAARRRRALVAAGAEIEAQRSRLRVRRLQLVISDPYGTDDLSRWTREKAHFCRSRILRLLAAQGLAELWPEIAREVDRRIERAAASPDASLRRVRGRRRAAKEFSRFDPAMAPTDYERHCAVLLRKAGWEAEVTAATGDQGTDVLARRGRRSLVLQCKLYSKPVGNSAVQQIAAARAHHRADFAAVVSNADFTRRARELAATNGVYLLHHDELADFPPSR